MLKTDKKGITPDHAKKLEAAGMVKGNADVVVTFLLQMLADGATVDESIDLACENMDELTELAASDEGDGND